MRRAVLDAGVIISFLEGELRDFYEKVVNEEVEAYVSVVNLAEVYYVLCRKLGKEKAKEITGKLLRSGYFRVVGVKPKILRLASECKCKNSISLADCFAIATAKYLKAKAVFRRERELSGIDRDVEFVG